jgi:hypothetical protein
MEYITVKRTEKRNRPGGGNPMGWLEKGVHVFSDKEMSGWIEIERNRWIIRDSVKPVEAVPDEPVEEEKKYKQVRYSTDGVTWTEWETWVRVE